MSAGRSIFLLVRSPRFTWAVADSGFQSNANIKSNLLGMQSCRIERLHADILPCLHRDCKLDLTETKKKECMVKLMQA